MKNLQIALATALAAVCAGCTSDKVIFVTSSSVGINLDTTPGSISLAYDRTEGYVAPSYQSGTLPPVMASIDTDGTPIAPKIRQLYATGAAAVIVGGGTASEPTSMTRRNGKLTFVGTTTTLGLKAAFTSGAPESVNLGFKRKEFSYIPLGCQVAPTAQCDADSADLYPSVIASYDTSIDLPGAASTTFKTRQFVATGTAATALAPSVAPDFRAIGKESVAFQAGKREAAAHLQRVDSILAYAAPGGAFDTGKFNALVATANAAPGATPIAGAIAGSTSADQLRMNIGADDEAAKQLAAAIPKGSS